MSDTPQGAPDRANRWAALKSARSRAHTAFDRVWQSKQMTRNEAYWWLAQQLNRRPGTAHIGSMTEDECERVVAICRPLAQQRRIRVIAR